MRPSLPNTPVPDEFDLSEEKKNAELMHALTVELHGLWVGAFDSIADDMPKLLTDWQARHPGQWGHERRKVLEDYYSARDQFYAMHYHHGPEYAYCYFRHLAELEFLRIVLELDPYDRGPHSPPRPSSA